MTDSHLAITILFHCKQLKLPKKGANEGTFLLTNLIAVCLPFLETKEKEKKNENLYLISNSGDWGWNNKVLDQPSVLYLVFGSILFCFIDMGLHFIMGFQL